MSFSQQHKTAILVFAHSAGEEIKHKPILNGIQLFDALTEHAIQIAEKSTLPYFHFSEERQNGNTFGERFVNAIQAVFDRGFDRVITIGNDVPSLKVSHIMETKKQLETKKFVLGPSADGGFYLMGIHKSQFDPIVFKELAWQTSNLSKQLSEKVKQQHIEIFQLPTLFDIDSSEDLKPILSNGFQLLKKLRKALLNAIGFRKNKIFIQPAILQTLLISRQHNKGSPIQLCMY